MSTKRIALIALVVLAIAGGIYGLSEYQRGHEETSGLKADFSLSIESILAEYQQDSQAANEKYLDKVVEITGTVDEVTQLEGGGSNVVLTEGANCSFLEKVELMPGSTVKVKGICSGFQEEEIMDILEVNLTRCALVKP
jgi:hypothetical protein